MSGQPTIAKRVPGNAQLTIAGHSISRRKFLKLSAGAVLTAALAGAGGADYAHNVEPDWVQIDRVRATPAGLPSAFDGYRIAQISDIHMGDWMTRSRLDEAVSAVNGLTPDMIAVTGDFVTRRADPFAHDLI